MNVSVTAFRSSFPPRANTAAVTGWIPINEFDSVEKELRKEMRKRGMRVYYRGARPLVASADRTVKPQHTKRKDATHAVVYFNTGKVAASAPVAAPVTKRVKAVTPSKAAAKPDKPASKADLIRAAIANCKHLLQEQDVVVQYGIAELGMKPAMARRYTAENWDKVPA